jgi:hypothetical protein
VFQSDGGGLDVKNESGHDARFVRHPRSRTKPQTNPPRRGRSLTFTQKGTLQTILASFPPPLQMRGLAEGGWVLAAGEDSVIAAIEVGKARSRTVSQPAALEKGQRCPFLDSLGIGPLPGCLGRVSPRFRLRNWIPIRTPSRGLRRLLRPAPPSLG